MIKQRSAVMKNFIVIVKFKFEVRDRYICIYKHKVTEQVGT